MEYSTMSYFQNSQGQSNQPSQPNQPGQPGQNPRRPNHRNRFRHQSNSSSSQRFGQRPQGQRSNRPNPNGNRHGGFRPPTQSQPTAAEQHFFSSVSVDPTPRIRLETGLSELTTRAIDLLAPIGRGQRGLIVSPPKSGKTTILKHLCQAITASQPDMKVYCLLIDERPEEVTDFRRNVTAEVRWSSSDQPYENHIRVAQMLMRQAVEEADSGKDVMILLDSLTRLARVHNLATRGMGRTLSGGVDAAGLLIPRKIFGSARKIEHRGSLGILATILVQTGSRMDDVIFQEFKGTGNMELVLSREVSDRRIFPALNIKETGTRKEELLLSSEELDGTRRLRAALAGMNDIDAAQTLVDLLKKYPTNELILASLR
jgi:transcription termination factor Rho